MPEAESRQKIWSLLLNEARKRDAQNAGLKAITLGDAWKGEISGKIDVSLPSESALLKDDQYAASSQESPTEEKPAASEAIQPSAKAEQGSPDAEVGVSEKAESDEIPDEIYAELGAALAADWTAAIKAGQEKMFEFLMNDDEGLWAAVRQDIFEELKEQGMLGADKAEISEALQDSARQALADAFDGLWEALAQDGGYEWLLTREEA